MNNARCLSCGLVIRGRWKNGPPAACPRCGFSGSKEKIKLAITAAKEKQITSDLTATIRAVDPSLAGRPGTISSNEK